VSEQLHSVSEHLLRELAPQVLGAVIRRFHDFADAEDAVQEALLAASVQWPREGVPDNPRGWLIQVACRRMTDQIRSESARRRRETAVAEELERLAPVSEIDTHLGQDDTLILLFMCCHPALSQSSAIALTLPTDQEQAQRLSAVLHVLYLIFNEGYVASVGPQVQRLELSSEAIRLTRALHSGVPENAEVGGLLALMLLTNARRKARTGPNEEMIPLAKQDRRLWDQSEISEGIALVTAALSKGSISAYQLQAAIAAVHAEAATVEETDWPQILTLYELLKRMSDNPMVALNHAVAAAMVRGPVAGLTLLLELDQDGRLAGHHRLDAVRGYLLEMSGDPAGAIAHYKLAAERTTSLPERNYLLTQIARLGHNIP
jgi:predicted RNA polymerase sigma factor